LFKVKGVGLLNEELITRNEGKRIGVGREERGRISKTPERRQRGQKSAETPTQASGEQIVKGRPTQALYCGEKGGAVVGKRVEGVGNKRGKTTPSTVGVANAGSLGSQASENKGTGGGALICEGGRSRGNGPLRQRSVNRTPRGTTKVLGQRKT